VFLNLDADFAVGESDRPGSAERDVEALDDVGSQFGLALPVKTIRLS
jgi:hypothetical protein